MKSNAILFDGLAFVFIAGFAVLDYLISSTFVSALIWVAAFAVLGGIFFFAYFVNGLRALKWLFPACIFTALSEIIFIVSVDTINDLWALGLAALAIPALVGYFVDRSRHVNSSIAAIRLDATI